LGFFKGKIINRSSVALLVIETTTNDGVQGKPPAVVHTLSPGKKSPITIDADGFKRADSKAVQGHKSWWKIKSLSTADVFDDGSDLTVFVIWKTAVKENEFGEYEIDDDKNWGDPIVDVVSIIKNRKNQTTGYILQDGTKLTRSQAVKQAERGALDNVFVYKSMNKTKFLRSRRDSVAMNNLRVETV
jgi:hypothetical protein